MLLLPAARAEEAAFEGGLKQLAALGLPAMQGATWMKAPGDFRDGVTDSYQFQEMGVNLSGNVWRLSGDPAVHLGFGTSAPLEIPDSGQGNHVERSGGSPGLLGKMLQNYKEKNPEPEKKPKPPEEAVSLAAKDALKLAEALRKPSSIEELNNWIRWGNSDFHGRLLLFAAQLHAAGDTESANTLAAALFQAAEHDPALIDGAISHLADTEYNTAAKSFFETTDWATYHAAIKALLEKYPRGWANAPAVALLSSQLEKRASAPPKIALQGVTLKPEALALLDKLLDKQTVENSDEALARARGINLNEYPKAQRAQMIAWLRESAGEGIALSDTTPWLLAYGAAPEAPPSSPVEALKAMGMDGFIALAAACSDETLVPLRKQNEGGSYYSSNESPAVAIRRRYANLNRPLTRGEIATALVSASLPMSDEQSHPGSNEADPASIAATAVEFWNANRDKNPVQLATLYIAEGNSQQRSHAATFLSGSKDPAAHAAFEKTVLAADDPLSYASVVDSYLGTRKAAAKTFANAYIKLLSENPPSEEDLQRTAAGWEIRQAGGLDNYLKKLSLKVGDVSLRKMIADALRAKPEETTNETGGKPSPIVALHSAIATIPLEECLETFGKLHSTVTPLQWMDINELLLMRIRGDQRSGDQDGGVENFRVLPDNLMAIWKPMMASAEPLPDEGNFPRYARSYGAATVGDASTLLIEMASSPNLTYMSHHYALSEGSPAVIMETARKRVAAWSSGKEPEPWPDEANVSEARRKEITGKLATLKAEEIAPYLRSLTKDERLSFYYMTRSYGDPDPVPPGILELRNTLVSLTPVFGHDHDGEAAAKLGLAVGDKVTPELVTKISDALLKEAANASTTTVMLFPGPMNLGTSLHVTTNRQLDLMKARESGLQYTAGLFGQHGNPDAMCVILADGTGDLRILKDGKPVTIGSEVSALSDLAKALESESFTLPAIRISVLTRADAEKIEQQQE